MSARRLQAASAVMVGGLEAGVNEQDAKPNELVIVHGEDLAS